MSNALLKNVRNIYMIGIKGTGMSALAVNLKHMGYVISGSDSSESFFTDQILISNKIEVKSPFSADNIPDQTDLVIISTAYNNTNPEVAESNRRQLTIKTYPEILGLLSQELQSIAICGSHGKTTTSAALGYIMHTSRYNPLINVGSIVPQLRDYVAHDPQLFIFEADEYQNKFQHYYPWSIILTNIDYDHPDFFKNERQYLNSFKQFIAKLSPEGLLVYYKDDDNILTIAPTVKARTISYGTSDSADYHVTVGTITDSHMDFTISHAGIVLGDFRSLLLGQHNALNLTAAIIMARELGISLDDISKAISEFSGTKRRIELLKTIKINSHDVIIIDDFAHHPTEIKATLNTIKTAYPDRNIWVVFQPHTFSRTEALFDDFSQAFELADNVIILDIYGSTRESSGNITAQDLVHAIAKTNPDKDVYHAHDLDEASEIVKNSITADSILLTMGATELWRLKDLL